MNSNPRRVVITGIGLISPLGSTKEALWEALSQARSAVRPLDRPGSRRLACPRGGRGQAVHRRHRRLRPA